MASKKNTEYTVRDYSAVDAQVLQIAERERVRTQKMKIANLGSLVILGLYIAGALAILILISGIAYRIAFPPDVEIVERYGDFLNSNYSSKSRLKLNTSNMSIESCVHSIINYVCVEIAK